MQRRREIRIGRPSLGHVEGRGRVEASVEGFPVFFESSDFEPAPSVEAFAGPFVLAALEERAVLRLDEPPSATWLENARALTALYRRWWGYSGPDPFEGVEARPDERSPRPEGGQCFSGGIDSFYTLRTSPHRRDVLVALHGFDIALADDRRMDAFTPSLRTIAASSGRRAVVVRTSIRRHPLLRRLSWDREHGAVLAAAGHVLSDTIGSLVIPASWSRDWKQGWGSHWDSDPLWSSDRLRVIHDDATLERWDKVPFLVDDPLFFEHLRVCWENRVPEGNCGVCEKCVRTRVVFARCGVLERGERAFHTTLPLIDAIDRLPTLSVKQLTIIWERSYLHWELPAELHAAIERLCVRSHRFHAAGPATRLLRRVRKGLRRLKRIGNPRPR
jgi:hypothetical protein